MGWCHEFGPQIHEGCDHPMVAGATSCTCEVCGSECTGKFAGCADVWARGPRLVAPRTPVTETVARVPAVTETLARVAPGEGSVAGRAAPPSPEAAPGGGVSPEITAELAALGRRLDQVSTKLGALESARRGGAPATDQERETMNRVVARLVGRVAALEDQAAPAAGSGAEAVFEPEALAALVERVRTLEQAPDPGPAVEPEALAALVERVRTLEQAPEAEPAEPAVPASLATQLEQLATQVAALRMTPERLAALEETSAQLDTLVHDQGELRRALEEQPAKVEAAALPANTRIRALEGVLAETVQSIGRLSSRVTALEDLPKRLEALEQATPPEKLVTALAKRIDRLSTQMAASKDLPARVSSLEGLVPDASRIEERTIAEVGTVSAEVESLAAGVETLSGDLAGLRRQLAETVPRLGELEATQAAVAERVAPDRAEALASGLGHAIDMIDQLAHQVAMLEQRAVTDPPSP